MRRFTLVAAMFLLAATGARADGSGALASVSSLDAASRARVESSIAQARAREPGTFDAVRSIVARADGLDRRKQGRFVAMAPILRGVARGHAGSAMALLEPIVAPERFALPTRDSARIALRAGLIEAAGDQKDPSAAPVYRAILASGSEFFELRAAADALGKIASDSDVAMLSSLATTPGPKQDAVIAGLGSCRRVAAAHALASIASQGKTGMAAIQLLRSLSAMGSAWTLQTAPAAEAPAIRETTARAAFAIFVATREDDVRNEAATALVVIDHPDAPQWALTAKSSASPELASALDVLARRLTHNATRTR
ncbi:MAG TPA: hypothetical protein VGH28_32730 [Polyangiaceae bacterium]|jgi:hypothetical protein